MERFTIYILTYWKGEELEETFIRSENFESQEEAEERATELEKEGFNTQIETEEDDEEY